jgi:hypothetical protein
MKSMFLAAGAILALLNGPAALAAQDEAVEGSAMDVGAPADPMAGMGEMFAGLFTKEPLTPEQEARLPAAEALIGKVIPAGTMGEMMDKLMNGVLGPMMSVAPDAAITTLAKQTGIETYALTIDEEQAGILASLFDPAWKERQQREAAMVPEMMREVMGLMEPGMRKAMSELYAIRFSSAELAEIDSFFSTGTGSKYARESFLMASDPRIMASTMEAMPALMGMIGNIEARMAERMADLPPVRTFADLTPAERAQVAEATGYSVEEIEATLEARQFEVSTAEATLDADTAANADAAAANAAAESE